MKRARHGGKEENKDRLSGLPDCILLHILGFMHTKHVVQTCVLSKRWKNLWKHVPNLLLHSSEFKKVEVFRRFVTKVLRCRDGSIALCNLDFQRGGRVEPYFLKRIVRYAVSHNIQILRMCTSIKYVHELPATIFSCQSITSLKLSVSVINTMRSRAIFPKSLSMAALINLHLKNFAFCPSDDGRADPFTNCKNLHTLIIDDCTLRDAQILCISNARVANLVICYCEDVDKIVLSTPNLQSFSFTDYRPLKLVGSNLSFLEEADIDVWSHCAESALILNSWLAVFTNVKSMTLSSSTLQVLSLIPDLLNTRPPCFGNLNTLKVEMRIYAKTIPYGVVDYLLQNSPSAEVTIINDEAWLRRHRFYD